MKFRFNLEKVLQHRKILENLAQREFQEALSNYNRVLSEIENMIDVKKQALRRSYDLVSQTGGQVLDSVNQIQDFMVLQDIRIDQMTEKLEELEKLVEAKREVLRQKAMDKKILERLKDKRKADFQAEMSRREQKEIDDIVSMRFEESKKTNSI